MSVPFTLGRVPERVRVPAEVRVPERVRVPLAHRLHARSMARIKTSRARKGSAFCMRAPWLSGSGYIDIYGLHARSMARIKTRRRCRWLELPYMWVIYMFGGCSILVALPCYLGRARKGSASGFSVGVVGVGGTRSCGLSTCSWASPSLPSVTRRMSSSDVMWRAFPCVWTVLG